MRKTTVTCDRCRESCDELGSYYVDLYVTGKRGGRYGEIRDLCGSCARELGTWLMGRTKHNR